MKNFKIYALALLVSLTFNACDDDPEEALEPVISNVVAVNHDDNTSVVSRGGQIAIDFDAKANSSTRMDYYHIEIHDHPASGEISDEYKIIDDSFKNDDTFKGVKNPHVHKHVTVPDTANLGSYHVVVIVVDENGYSTDTEALETHITVVE